ncbi:LuxR C-terminal-related transcriptional regulator [Streptomyces californicus]|uniref:helix-turn-helix transcriptional regulator n=1 Tax=Streptomyces californicus TaxID=67351 RepID=UPI00296F7E4F|nr:AAA family ATPase [Streptomyces californicus]MDW4899870.1 LuxR C-terminal-related transcriptional regulator [Streptomyces californicus]
MNAEPPLSAPGALIGRSRLLDDLRTELERRPSVVAITGETGVGKSRFVRELLHGAAIPSPCGIVLTARCREPDTSPAPCAACGSPPEEARALCACGRAADESPAPCACGPATSTPPPPSFAPIIEAFTPAGPLAAGLLGALPRHLPPVTGALRGLLPDLADRLPPAPPPLAEPQAEHHRVLRALCAMTAHLGDAVLAVEDLQWADAGTRAFLRTVVSDPPPRLGLVLTAREDGDGLPFPVTLRAPSHVTVAEQRLPPLSVAESGELAAGLLGARAVPEEFAERLHRGTGGLPYVVEEVLRRRPGRTDEGGDGGGAAGSAPGAEAEEVAGGEPGFAPPDGAPELPLPASVRRIVVERLDRLPPAARRVVAAAAVLRDPAPVDLLSAVAGSGGPETRRALTEALHHGVLRAADGRYAFPYDLARRAAHDAVPEPERPVLHLRAARALARQPGPVPLAAMAGHYRHAGRRTEAARCLEAAADRAAGGGDAGTAAAHYLDALRDGPSPAARDRIALKLARVALNARPGPQVPAALRQVLDRHSLDPGPAGEIRLLLGLLLRNQSGSGTAALEEIARAVPDLLTVSTGQAARALAITAIPSLKGWPFREHRRLLAEAERLLPEIAEEELRSAVLANRATALALMGDPSAGEAVADLPGTLTGEAAARVYANLAGAATSLGHLDRAHAFQDRAWQAVRTHHAPYLEAFVETTDLVAAFTGGRWKGLLERAEHAEEQYRNVPDFHAEALLVCGLLRLHTKGQTDVARRLLDRAVHTTALDTGVVLTSAAAAAARVHLAAARPAQAVQAAQSALHHVRRTGAWVWATPLVPTTVDALIRDGRPDEAHRLAAELAEGIADRDAPAARAALLTCRALLTPQEGRHPAASPAPPTATDGPRPGSATPDALYGAAADAWTRLDRPWEAAYVREAWGLHLLATGTAGGRTVLHEAIAAYQDLDAVWDVLRCRRGLREHGEVTVRRPGALGYGDHLSPRERAVARLASLGLSNREIARELVLSHRTVEHHVARALRKLGVSSRTEIGPQLGP